MLLTSQDIHEMNQGKKSSNKPSQVLILSQITRLAQVEHHCFQSPSAPIHPTTILFFLPVLSLSSRTSRPALPVPTLTTISALTTPALSLSLSLSRRRLIHKIQRLSQPAIIKAISIMKPATSSTTCSLGSASAPRSGYTWRCLSWC